MSTPAGHPVVGEEGLDLAAELEGDMEKMPFHDTGPKLKEWSLAHHIRHSPVTVVFNVVILSLVTVLLIWVIATPDHNPRSGLYWLIEAIVTFAIVFDLATEVRARSLSLSSERAAAACRGLRVACCVLACSMLLLLLLFGHMPWRSNPSAVCVCCMPRVPPPPFFLPPQWPVP